MNWLNNELEKVIKDVESDDIYFAGKPDYDEGYIDGIRDVQPIINQLETEVLSQKWIDNNSVYASSDGITEEYVHVDDLQNLLVPNQEVLSQEWITENSIEGDFRGIQEFWYGEFIEKEKVQNLLVSKHEKPVIPKFVADFIEETKKQYRTLVFAITHIYNKNEIGASPNKEEERIYQWMEAYDNEEVFARAWLDGFTVEVEQKYYVMNNDNRMMLVRMMDGKTITESDPFMLEDMYEGEKESHRLTEQEIKDYDPRYWAFAKPVEELE